MDKSFKQNTQDYRNKSQHQLPPNLDFGEGVFVLRTPIGNDSFSYTFLSDPPLKTMDMIPVLFEQGEKMRSLFYHYWNLVLEQGEAINSSGIFLSES